MGNRESVLSKTFIGLGETSRIVGDIYGHALGGAGPDGDDHQCGEEGHRNGSPGQQGVFGVRATTEYFVSRLADDRAIDRFFPLGVRTEQRAVTEVVDQSWNAVSELMNPAYRPSAEKRSGI